MNRGVARKLRRGPCPHLSIARMGAHVPSNIGGATHLMLAGGIPSRSPVEGSGGVRGSASFGAIVTTLTEQILQFALLASIRQSPAPGSEFVYGASLSAHQPPHPAVREGVGRAPTRRKGSAVYELFPETRRCSFHVSARRAGAETFMEQICHVRQRAGMRGFPFGAPATTSCCTGGGGTSSNAPKGKPRMPALSRGSGVVRCAFLSRRAGFEASGAICGQGGS